jgi:hypothetical protein
MKKPVGSIVLNQTRLLHEAGSTTYPFHGADLNSIHPCVDQAAIFILHGSQTFALPCNPSRAASLEFSEEIVQRMGSRPTAVVPSPGF